MGAQARPARFATAAGATALLRAAAAGWTGAAVLGQLLFAVYVAGFYGRAALAGRLQDWRKVLTQGYVPGDGFLNLVLMLHLAFAVAILLGGALQLLPALRRRAPAVHRWNGRAYLLLAAVMSLGGLLMVWLRGTVGDLAQHLAISLNALLILACAGAAWRHARARRLEQHRRWALRLFLVVSGVWFFRIGLMLWIVLNHGPAGFDEEHFTGPALTVLSFAQTLLPLAVLELYLRARAHPAAGVRLAMAAGLALLTLATLGGTAAAAAILWLPRLWLPRL